MRRTPAPRLLRGAASGVSTGHLGMELESDSVRGAVSGNPRLRKMVLQQGLVRVSVGDFLIAINGKPVRAGDNYWHVAYIGSTARVKSPSTTSPPKKAPGKLESKPLRQMLTANCATSGG